MRDSPLIPEWAEQDVDEDDQAEPDDADAHDGDDA